MAAFCAIGHDNMEGATRNMQTGEGFDQATYDATKTYLKAALEQMIAAGHSTEGLAEFATDKFGGSFYPYLREFEQDIRAGRIKVQGLAASERASIFSARVAPVDRERLIRETAYLRAERRGFVGGSPEEDWLAAEDEVDERLARQAGLLSTGNKRLEKAGDTVKKEFGSIQSVVYRWLEGKEFPGKNDTGAAKKEARTPRRKKASPAAMKPAISAKGQAGARAATEDKPAAATEPGPSKGAKATTAGKRQPVGKASSAAQTRKQSAAEASSETAPTDTASDGAPESAARPERGSATNTATTNRKSGAGGGRRRPASRKTR